MARAFLYFLFLLCSAYNRSGGIVRAVSHSVGIAMVRLDSSLRSHRTWRSQCRDVFSGLNKTLFASVGPNSHGRDHRQDTTLAAARGLRTKEEDFLPGRMKPCRGHRLDGTPSHRGVTSIPHDVVCMARRC